MYGTITTVDFRTFPSPQEGILYPLAINLLSLITVWITINCGKF